MAGHDFNHGLGEFGEVISRLGVAGDLVLQSKVPDLGQGREDVVLVVRRVGLAEPNEVLLRKK